MCNTHSRGGGYSNIPYQYGTLPVEGSAMMSISEHSKRQTRMSARDKDFA
ncbi:MAG TPA: hypothetical protein VI033_01725 [Candidatus Nitrosopolaris sp.]